MFYRLPKFLFRLLIILIIICIIVLFFQYISNLNSIKENKILFTVEKWNYQQIIFNKNKFNEFNNDSVVIVVQVHNRTLYLKALIESLRQAKDISKTLLIFSHDYFDENLNKLIQNIDFCKVIQIFYPYSIQLYPNVFPGTHPNDCPRNIQKAKAITIGCNNALYPDKYGNYREAKYVQIKHHWWWKVNRIFNELEITKNYNGYIIFLEEDHYVTEDFVDMFYWLKDNSLFHCPECNVLTLGMYLIETSSLMYDKVKTTPWNSVKHNMGFAINRSTWHDINNCDYLFCTYDDYNWDWSLQYVSNNCLKNKLYTMAVMGPRVFHIGKCGMHNNGSLCNPNNEIDNIKALLNEKGYNKQLFLPKIVVKGDGIGINHPYTFKENGGWGDKLDRELCMNISKTKKLI